MGSVGMNFKPLSNIRMSEPNDNRTTTMCVAELAIEDNRPPPLPTKAGGLRDAFRIEVSDANLVADTEAVNARSVQDAGTTGSVDVE